MMPHEPARARYARELGQLDGFDLLLLLLLLRFGFGPSDHGVDLGGVVEVVLVEVFVVGVGVFGGGVFGSCLLRRGEESATG